jgi:ankyrin repeat protein
VVKLLLANKAEINAKDKDGNTPLSLAEKYRYNDIIEFLRQHGVNE